VVAPHVAGVTRVVAFSCWGPQLEANTVRHDRRVCTAREPRSSIRTLIAARDAEACRGGTLTDRWRWSSGSRPRPRYGSPSRIKHGRLRQKGGWTGWDTSGFKGRSHSRTVDFAWDSDRGFTCSRRMCSLLDFADRTHDFACLTFRVGHDGSLTRSCRSDGSRLAMAASPAIALDDDGYLTEPVLTPIDVRFSP